VVRRRGLAAVVAATAAAAVAAAALLAAAAGLLAAPAGLLAAPVGAAQSASTRTGQQLPRTHCPVFPADNVWNSPVTGLPVDSHSAEWLSHMAAGSTDLHPDYGPGGGSSPYGIQWQVTSTHPKLVRVHFDYADESDRGPYPFSANTPIEGGAQASGDRHALMVDPKTCILYELYDAYFHPGGRSTAGSGAIWSLNSNRLRPATWTSADAAGLPILPGLINYDEVMSGHLDHAIRFTAQTTDTRFIWPARHEAGAVSNGAYPPMGARFRLKASFRLPRSQCARPCQVVLQAMKTYGLILADNGSNWYFGGTTDSRWTYTMVDQLKAIPASEFQAVDESCLIVNRNSGEARQPGTGAYARACGAHG
jgi:cytochrome c5